MSIGNTELANYDKEENNEKKETPFEGARA